MIFKYVPDVGLKVGALSPLLPIPIIHPLLPDESIRFPRPDAQQSTYMIDSIENAPPTPLLIYNGPISPLREFYAPWRPHTVRWERGKCTFVMNFIICIKNRWKLGIPAERRCSSCRCAPALASTSPRGASESPLMSHQEHPVVSCFYSFTVSTFLKKRWFPSSSLLWVAEPVLPITVPLF